MVAVMVTKRSPQRTALALLGAALGAAWLEPAEVGAYGLLVQRLAGAEAGAPASSPLNGETNVILLREGTRTVLTFQNDYRGPAQDFALIVPVPVVLNPADVHTLHASVVEMVQRAAQPTLVELWEQDPCPPPEPEYDYRRMKEARMSAPMPVAEEKATNGIGHPRGASTPTRRAS